VIFVKGRKNYEKR